MTTVHFGWKPAESDWTDLPVVNPLVWPAGVLAWGLMTCLQLRFERSRRTVVQPRFALVNLAGLTRTGSGQRPRVFPDPRGRLTLAVGLLVSPHSKLLRHSPSMSMITGRPQDRDEGDSQ